MNKEKCIDQTCGLWQDEKELYKKFDNQLEEHEQLVFIYATKIKNRISEYVAGLLDEDEEVKQALEEMLNKEYQEYLDKALKSIQEFKKHQEYREIETSRVW